MGLPKIRYNQNNFFQVSGSGTLIDWEGRPAILTFIRDIRRSLHWTRPASTPAKAMALAKEHAGGIDLLITDVVMPEMNGRELAETLQARYPDLKVLFMSGYTANVIAHRGVLKEGVHFIWKSGSARAVSRRPSASFRGRDSSGCFLTFTPPAVEPAAPINGG